ncbi:MAG: hypothetical protein AVDCRST_MAG37-1184, partial [uncultured Rubrobacteraceae bacterium]
VDQVLHRDEHAGEAAVTGPPRGRGKGQRYRRRPSRQAPHVRLRERGDGRHGEPPRARGERGRGLGLEVRYPRPHGGRGSGRLLLPPRRAVGQI